MEQSRTILHTTDISSIRAILGCDNIYDTMSYDGSPTLQEYVPTGVWLILMQEEDICGAINLEPMNNIMWQAHIAIFPEYRGRGSEEWGIMAAQWMRTNGASKILAITPYESAKHYAERMGMQNVCVLTHSIRKNGQLLNQYMLEMNL